MLKSSETDGWYEVVVEEPREPEIRRIELVLALVISTICYDITA